MRNGVVAGMSSCCSGAPGYAWEWLHGWKDSLCRLTWQMYMHLSITASC